MSDYGYCPTCRAPGVHRSRMSGVTRCMNGHTHEHFDQPVMLKPVRESTIEDYFVEQVRRSGGEQRKVVFPGHPGAPDRWAGWRATQFHALVELKRPDGKPEAHQAREHEKLRACGLRVYVLSTKQEVDAFIRIALSKPTALSSAMNSIDWPTPSKPA